MELVKNLAARRPGQDADDLERVEWANLVLTTALAALRTIARDDSDGASSKAATQALLAIMQSVLDLGPAASKVVVEMAYSDDLQSRAEARGLLVRQGLLTVAELDAMQYTAARNLAWNRAYAFSKTGRGLASSGC